MNFKISLHFILLLIVTACMSLKNDSNQLVDKSDIIFPIIQNIKNKCYVKEKAGFLVELTSLSQGTSFQLEGAWKNDFKKLILQVLGPIGEDYVTLEIDQHDLSSQHLSLNGGQYDEAKELIEFISALGSERLRDLFCGIYPFSSDSKIYKKIANPLFYENQTNWEVQTHTILGENKWSLENSPKEKNGYELSIDSLFSAKYLFSSSKVRVHWKGGVGTNQLIPEILDVTLPKNKFNLTFLQFH